MNYIINADIVKIMELKKDKPLHEFNREDILQVIGELNPLSIQSAITQLSVIKKYIDFAIANGFLTTGINFATLIKTQDIERVVNMQAMDLKYITKEEVIDITDSLDNAVDAAFITLLFEGVKGEQLSEIVNLQKNDIDHENNMLELTDKDGNIRHKRVSTRTIGILQEASSQTEYLVRFDTSKRKLEFTKQLQNSNYVIRTTGTKYNAQTKYRTLLAKLRSIRSEIGNPYLTATSIWESGMINYAKEIMEQNGLDNLTTKHYKEICRWAGKSEDMWFNTKRVILSFI